MAEAKKDTPKIDPETAAAIGVAVAQAMAPIVAELRKPVKTEKEIQAEQEAEADRLRMRETMRLREENRLKEQAACTHMRSNGTTTAVYVYANGSSSDYLICQACQKCVYPSAEPDLFNKLMQAGAAGVGG